MSATSSALAASKWLLENGPKALELLFRAVVYYPSAPILIADNDGTYRDASAGASQLLGVPREKIIGRPIADFAPAALKPEVSQLWRAFLEEGETAGEMRLLGPDGSLRPVDVVAKGNILPGRHVVVLSDVGAAEPIPAWVQDYALFLMDADWGVATWYSGAERIYGYSPAEAIGHPISFLYPADAMPPAKVLAETSRAETTGHVGSEGWHMRKDGSRFWANAITMALKGPQGVLQGFACVVRDFSERHVRDEQVRVKRSRVRPVSSVAAVAGIASGEFDRVPEINDALLDLIGYTREDVATGVLCWPELTPPEYAAQDELAHEEGLRFGACAPFEKELICKDGTRVPVLITTAVLKLAPFRWI